MVEGRQIALYPMMSMHCWSVTTLGIIRTQFRGRPIATRSSMTATCKDLKCGCGLWTITMWAVAGSSSQYGGGCTTKKWASSTGSHRSIQARWMRALHSSTSSKSLTSRGSAQSGWWEWSLYHVMTVVDLSMPPGPTCALTSQSGINCCSNHGRSCKSLMTCCSIKGSSLCWQYWRRRASKSSQLCKVDAMPRFLGRMDVCKRLPSSEDSTSETTL